MSINNLPTEIFMIALNDVCVREIQEGTVKPCFVLDRLAEVCFQWSDILKSESFWKQLQTRLNKGDKQCF